MESRRNSGIFTANTPKSVARLRKIISIFASLSDQRTY